MTTLQIIRDRREQLPYEFAGYDCTVTPGTLRTGDYGLVGHEGLVSVERKSLDDLAGCCTTSRDRWERELARGADMECFVVVVESDPASVLKHRYRSKLNPNSLLQSTLAWQLRYGVHFLWAGSRAAGEYMTHGVLAKWGRESERKALDMSNGVIILEDSRYPVTKEN